MTLEEKISLLNTWANNSRILLYNLEDDLSNLEPSQYNIVAHADISYIALANREVLKDLIKSMQYFVYGYTSSFNYTYWRDIHQGLYDKEAELTPEAICEAWAKDDFAGRTITIAFIDRMRQILWNEPFSAVWAARPETE